jgi:hypothetical protein
MLKTTGWSRKNTIAGEGIACGKVQRYETALHA